MRRTLGLLALTLVAAALLLPVTPAAAGERRCHTEAVKNPDGSISYTLVCVDVQPGTPGEPGGPAEDCGQDEVTPQPGDGPYFCWNGIPCTYTDNIVPLAPPSTPAPPGQQWQARYCTNGTKVLVLTGGEQPRPLVVQAQEAYGNLAAPAGVVRHSPDTRGIVGLPTWLWLAPASFGELTGSSAEGLVAVAEPAGTDWTTGDGGSVSCAGAGTPYGSAGPACTHTYRAASARYDGSVTRRWTVHYEQGGTRVDIPGAPAGLTAATPWSLAVAEAQVVTGGR